MVKKGFGGIFIMKILITGCCGFIGFNFTNFLAKSNKKVEIIGIDNLNEYYDINLKKDRLKNISKFSENASTGNFLFFQFFEKYFILNWIKIY